LKKRVWVSALSGLLVAVLLAMVVFGMPGALVASAAGHGVIFGVMRIGWIVVASIFLYNIASTTGQFQVMKDSIAVLSSDKRLQLVLIAFCFGAFLEGTGGGGAPVAIAGAFLIGLGFKPFQAATLCLLANTAPVAWGGVGNPIRVLAAVTGLPERHGGAHSAAPLVDPAVLAGAEHGRLARDAAGLAGVAGERRLVCRNAVLLVELSGAGIGGHRVRRLCPAGDGGVPQVLETGRSDPGQRPIGDDPEASFDEGSVERLVAVHHCVHPDLPQRLTRARQACELRCLENADAVSA
jgi:hypothetical protein